jgi:stage IV sporulation protein B
MRTYKKILAVISLSTLSAILSLYFYVVFALPQELTLIEGKDYLYDFGTPFSYNISVDKEGCLKLNGGEVTAAGSTVNFSKPVSLLSKKEGNVTLKVKLFGLLAVKEVNVNVVNTKEVVACGNTIGVKLRTNGVLVVGASPVVTKDGRSQMPFKDSGIKPGAIIQSVNDKEVDSIETLAEEISSSNGKPLKIAFAQNDQVFSTELTPVMAADDNQYYLGLWVKEGTAGIGTLSFIDPATGCFGALGHGITDSDIGILVPIETGEILESSILGVRVGEAGKPGELKGVFNEDISLGTIEKNIEYGIYGKINTSAADSLTTKLYPIALRSEIVEGPAKILSNVEGKSVKEYEIVIERVSRQSLNGSKGMVIRIVDEELLKSTGGIVQGMSGSPIIQNDKIVGAVTHVLVNDPAKGYGIFIEAMLNNLS